MAISAVIAELPGIGKDSENREQGYKFRSTEAILAHAKPLLAKHGVVIVPDVVERIYAQRAVGSKGDRIMHEVNLHVHWRIWGPHGDMIEASTWGEGTDMGDKATNKAHTGAHKNLLLELLDVADDSSDGDFTTPEESQRKTEAPPRKRREGSATPTTTGGPQGPGDKEAPAVTPEQQSLINRVAALPLEQRTLYLQARKDHIPPLPPIQDCDELQMGLVEQLIVFYEGGGEEFR